MTFRSLHMMNSVVEIQYTTTKFSKQYSKYLKEILEKRSISIRPKKMHEANMHSHLNSNGKCLIFQFLANNFCLEMLKM